MAQPGHAGAGGPGGQDQDRNGGAPRSGGSRSARGNANRAHSRGRSAGSSSGSAAGGSGGGDGGDDSDDKSHLLFPAAGQIHVSCISPQLYRLRSALKHHNHVLQGMIK